MPLLRHREFRRNDTPLILSRGVLRRAVTEEAALSTCTSLPMSSIGRGERWPRRNAPWVRDTRGRRGRQEITQERQPRRALAAT